MSTVIIELALPIAVGVLFVLVCRQWWQARSLRLDLQALQLNLSRACSATGQGGLSVQGRHRFCSEQGQKAARVLETLELQLRTQHRAQKGWQDTISLSADVISSAKEVKTAARHVIEMVRRACEGDSRGIAVLMREEGANGEERGELQIVAHWQVPTRLFHPLRFAAEDWLEHWTLQLSKQRQAEILEIGGIVQGVERQDPAWDFTALGVKRGLFVPICDERKVLGGIFIAIARSDWHLRTAQHELLSMVAKQAAVSLAVGREVKSHQESANREIEYLLGMSHDLRLPGIRALSVLEDILSNASATSLSGEQNAALQDVYLAVDEQLRLLSNVIDQARHERGALVAQRKSFLLSEVIEPMLERYSHAAKGKNIEINYRAAEELAVQFDPAHLWRIVGNLLSNGIKYGQGSIEVEAVEEGANVALTVITEARSLPASSEIEEKAPAEGEGSWDRLESLGLGLQVSQVLAGLNEATLSMERIAQGMKCVVQMKKAKSVIDLRSVWKTKIGTILVIEDDAALGRSVVRNLRERAEHVICARSVAEARCFFGLTEIDLVVSDMNLGDGGLEDILPSIPQSAALVVLSGSEPREIPPHAVYLAKPFSRGDLTRAILEAKAALDRRDMVAQAVGRRALS